MSHWPYQLEFLYGQTLPNMSRQNEHDFYNPHNLDRSNLPDLEGFIQNFIKPNSGRSMFISWDYFIIHPYWPNSQGRSAGIIETIYTEMESLVGWFFRFLFLPKFQFYSIVSKHFGFVF